jgi:hypothetical protein
MRGNYDKNMENLVVGTWPTFRNIRLDIAACVSEHIVLPIFILTLAVASCTRTNYKR